MIDNFYLALAAILLLPLIPAYIIYKFLPASDTDVSGPYKGLSLKLKGAFAGYFLLVLVAITLQYVIMSSKQGRSVQQLTEVLQQRDSLIGELKTKLTGVVTDWYVKGLVTPAGTEGTRFFFDDGKTHSNPDGTFELVKRSIASEGTATPPKWMCIYNMNTGFKVVSLNRELEHPDIAAYNITFDDKMHVIKINKPININSIARDSIVAVSNFIDKNPELKTRVLQINPNFNLEAEKVKTELQNEKERRTTFERMQQRKKLLRPGGQ